MTCKPQNSLFPRLSGDSTGQRSKFTLGLKRGTFANWKRGQSDSYLHYLKEIAEYFHVTPNYLILGEDGIVVKKGEDIFSKEELELINAYRNLALKEKRYFREILKIMQEK